MLIFHKKDNKVLIVKKSKSDYPTLCSGCYELGTLGKYCHKICPKYAVDDSNQGYILKELIEK